MANVDAVSDGTKKRVPILGINVSAINMDDAVAEIERWIVTQQKTYICITGAHGVMESRSSPLLKSIHNSAGLVTPDGMPLVWIANWRGFRRTRRVYGPDLMRRLSAIAAQRGWRNYYYGGGPGVANQLAKVLTTAHPELIVAGTHAPPFRSLKADEDSAEIAEINAAQPDIVWVGLSTPKQEFWMFKHRSSLGAPVLIGVGAAFDFLAGGKKQAPRWMQERGLEWLFRLCSEPRRLWRRYFRIVPGFMVLVICESLGSWVKKAPVNTSGQMGGG